MRLGALIDALLHQVVSHGDHVNGSVSIGICVRIRLIVCAAVRRCICAVCCAAV